MPVEALPNLPAATDILLDANIFIYAFGRQSSQCLDLLQRCAKEEVTGITTLEIVNEVCHRLMLAEAVNSGVITKESAAALKSKPGAVRQLTAYWQQTARIFSLNLLVLTLEEPRIYQAQQERSTHGLLTNDSLLLAAAQSYGINCLATRDGDFDAIPDINIYKPMDI